MLARQLAFAASLVFVGSVAHAAPASDGDSASPTSTSTGTTTTTTHHSKPKKKAKKKTKHADLATPAPTAAADDTARDDSAPRHADAARHDDSATRAGETVDARLHVDPRVAFESSASDTSVDAGKPADTGAETISKASLPVESGPGWHFMIGPYLWASAVDTNLSLGGGSSVGTGIGFGTIEQHAKYGAEVLAEVRHGKLVFDTDLMYGQIAVSGGTSLGPVMASLAGAASSVNVDAAVGYAVIGDDKSLISVEPRVGIRYQRTSLGASVGIEGISVTTPDEIMSSTDALIGARALVRPLSWAYLSGVFDYGVFGSSTLDWSAGVDASVQVISHVLVSLGYRTLTTNSSLVNLTLHGPRAAVQITF